MKTLFSITALLLLLLLSGMWSCTRKCQELPLDGFNDAIHHWNLVHKERNYRRYKPGQITKIADNLLAYQNEDGGWPKNIDWLAVLNTDSVYAALNENDKRSTLDNNNCFSQIEYVADVYRITGKDKYKASVLRGLDYLITQQHANGGWRGWDVDAITFNDEVTVGALDLFYRILQGDESYTWLDKERIEAIKAGYEKGLDLTLKLQILQDGVKTAWAQQYDNYTFQPVGARSYELPGLTANESCAITLFLMRIDHPSPQVIDAVEHAVAWFRKVAIHGISVERIPIPEDQIINHEYPYDKVVVEDSTARTIWARYYELADNTPFMCNRDGKKVWKLSDVEPERRTGYAWYGYWPQRVLNAYPDWIERLKNQSK